MLGKILASLEHVVAPRSLKHLVQPLQRLILGRLWLQVLIGMALGIVTGLLINPDAGFVSKPVAHAIGEWLALPGLLFLAFIQMIVVPLVLASIICGIAAATDVQQLRSTGLGLAVYFLATTVAAAVIGIVIGLTVRPGDYVDPSVMQTVAAEMPAETEKAID